MPAMTYRQKLSDPYFNQNRDIAIADWNIDDSRFKYHPQNQPFLAKNWLKWLKVEENAIS